MAPPVRAARRGFDWSTASIVFSIVGAAISIADRRLVLIAIIAFVLGLVVGVVAWRSGRRRNRAAIGMILNAANLILNAGLLLSSRA